MTSKRWPAIKQQIARPARGAAADRSCNRCATQASAVQHRSRNMRGHSTKSHSPKSSSYAQHIERVAVRESRIQYLCDPQWFRDTASRGPTTIVAPESQFRTCPTDHGKSV
ncbi:hypothetical protein F511_37175 [Dorcoceras hygrometricum]|uniref:Uncharacterized protein n=1 Tax=Dorcoceras hygrometricum TaxID=472368 RepID=A0A2Z7DCS7_9LAMI|nr:hypothetical protein F511_37175 [Dorcoceras hygrometricum]